MGIGGFVASTLRHKVASVCVLKTGRVEPFVATRQETPGIASYRNTHRRQGAANDTRQSCRQESLRTLHAILAAEPFSKGARMKLVTKIAIALTLLLAIATSTAAQTWTPINNQIIISVNN